ncbi:hypothetical protein ACWDZ8_45880 [Streptomyces sp. NPDC003233]
MTSSSAPAPAPSGAPQSIAQQLVLPATALLGTCCTFPGHWAVLAAGLVCSAAVAVGVALTARMVGRKRTASATALAG